MADVKSGQFAQASGNVHMGTGDIETHEPNKMVTEKVNPLTSFQISKEDLEFEAWIQNHFDVTVTKDKIEAKPKANMIHDNVKLTLANFYFNVAYVNQLLRSDDMALRNNAKLEWGRLKERYGTDNPIKIASGMVSRGDTIDSLTSGMEDIALYSNGATTVNSMKDPSKRPTGLSFADLKNYLPF